MPTRLPDGSHVLQDEEVPDDRVTEGRYSAELVAWVRVYGKQLTDRLDVPELPST